VLGLRSYDEIRHALFESTRSKLFRLLAQFLR
jgi:hypothetical protein